MSFFSRVVSTIRIHGGTILKSSLISSLPWLPVVYTVDSAVVTVANITGTSMQPTLSERDMVLIRKAFYTPSRGDVVILRDPRRPKGSILKRLVALEGDVVEIDPEELPETGAVPWLDFHQPLITGDSVFVQVPRGHCWVEGDNSETSIDSRFYGPSPEPFNPTPSPSPLAYPLPEQPISSHDDLLPQLLPPQPLLPQPLPPQPLPPQQLPFSQPPSSPSLQTTDISESEAD